MSMASGMRLMIVLYSVVSMTYEVSGTVLTVVALVSFSISFSPAKGMVVEYLCPYLTL